MPLLAAALWSVFLLVTAVCLLLNGRFQIFGGFVLISALMTGAGAMYEMIKGHQKNK